MARRASGGTVTAAVLHDALGFLVHGGGLGPLAAGGRQPWRFRVRHGGLDLLLDRSRLAGERPAATRLATLACGAALLDLRLAVGHLGFDPVVEHLPEPTDPDHLARLRVGPARPTAPEEERLVAAMALRRRPPGRFEPTPVAPDVLAELTSAVEEESARLLVPDGDLRSLLASVEPRESTAPGSPPGRARQGEAPDAVLVLATRGDDPVDHLAAGQALERLLLVGAARSTLARLSYALVADDVLRGRFRAHTSGEWYPQLVLHAGRVVASSLTVPAQQVEPLVTARSQPQVCRGQWVH